MINQAINKYFEFIVDQLTLDMNFVNNNFGWFIFIIPAIIWFFIMILKYIIILSPIIFPLNFATNTITSIIKINKKDK